MPFLIDTHAHLDSEIYSRDLDIVVKHALDEGVWIVTLGSDSGERQGYDLLGAFIGSEGCFGVALDVTVKLTKKPPAVRTMLADFTSVDDAARVTSAIIASGIVPAALEFMDSATIKVVESSIYAAGYPADAAAVLLIELDGLAPGEWREVRA